MVVRVEVRQPIEQDIKDLIENLSIEDRNELLIQGAEVEWAIRHSVETSDECIAIFGDGTLACMTGINVNDGLAPSATPWLLGTEFMQKYPRQVLAYSNLILNRWKRQHPFMFNYVDSRHVRAIAWLRRLGASFEEVPEHGPYKKPFFRFTFGVDPCA